MYLSLYYSVNGCLRYHHIKCESIIIAKWEQRNTSNLYWFLIVTLGVNSNSLSTLGIDIRQIFLVWKHVHDLSCLGAKFPWQTYILSSQYLTQINKTYMQTRIRVNIYSLSHNHRWTNILFIVTVSRKITFKYTKWCICVCHKSETYCCFMCVVLVFLKLQSIN